MIAASDAEETVFAVRSRIKRLRQHIGKLFMNMVVSDLDPEERIGEGQRKIAEARDFIETFHKGHPAVRNQKEKYPKVNELFAKLAASCDKAENRMGSYAERRLQRTNNADLN
jgi:hypothetical protein